MPPKWVFFSEDEVKGLDTEFVADLDRARGYAGVPFVLVSTVRTPDQNAAVGGAPQSTHCLGLGVDIGLGHLADGGERDHARLLILRGLLQAGFTRFGLYPEHIHVDKGQPPTYVAEVAWFKTAEG